MKIERIYISHFEKLCAFFKSLSDDEQQALAEGRLTIDFQVKGRKQPLPKKTSKRKTEQKPFDVQLVADTLHTFNSREAVQNYLSESRFTKSELESIIQRLGSVSSSKDSTEKLQNRIIETTVGYELRTQAIEQRERRVDLNPSDESLQSESVQ